MRRLLHAIILTAVLLSAPVGCKDDRDIKIGKLEIENSQLREENAVLRRREAEISTRRSSVIFNTIMVVVVLLAVDNLAWWIIYKRKK